MEGSHWFTGVWSDKSLKKRNRSLNLLLGKESDDSDLCQSAIVQLRDESLLLLLCTGVGRETKGVEKAVERHGVGDQIGLREFGELSWDTTTHVVCSGGLTEEFQESNEKDDLPLGGLWHGIPLFGRGKTIEGDIASNGWPGEKEVGLDTVSNEGSHGNTSVLDLGVTKVANGGLVTVSPDGSTGQLKGIIVLRSTRVRTAGIGQSW